MSTEHFGQNSTKMPIVFLINNIYYIVSQLQMLDLEKGAKDLHHFDKELTASIEAYIEQLLKANFAGLV